MESLYVGGRHYESTRMTYSFDARIARAGELTKAHPPAAAILDFYRHLVLLQKTIDAELRSQVDSDLQKLVRHFPALLELVRRYGPLPLADFGERHLRTPEAQLTLLTATGDLANDEAGKVFARVLIQPYAEFLASRGSIDLQGSEAVCPFCGAPPVAGVLRDEGDGAGRWLLCSVCSTEWPFRRVVCPSCGEQEKGNLPVYTAAAFAHVRVEACERCKTYLKCIDLTVDGHAVPVVDELATVALNIWAGNHGYMKIEANLLGM
jgi:FdhE protein